MVVLGVELEHLLPLLVLPSRNKSVQMNLLAPLVKLDEPARDVRSVTSDFLSLNKNNLHGLGGVDVKLASSEEAQLRPKSAASPSLLGSNVHTRVKVSRRCVTPSDSSIMRS